MSEQNAYQHLSGLLADMRVQDIHSLYPDEFEYYACSIIVEDSTSKMVDLFNFPVMPNSISISKRPLATIKKTARGYSNQISTSFSGDVISINGTFGRKFKLIMFENYDNTISNEGKFDSKMKTGYGALKMMEKLIYKSTQLDEHGSPHRLFFVNYSFNEMFYVEPVNWSKQQSLENNVIWNYSLELKALAQSQIQHQNVDVDYVTLKKKLSAKEIYDKVRKTINTAEDILLKLDRQIGHHRTHFLK